MSFNKWISFLFIIFISFNCFSQTTKEVDEINKLISPDYSFDPKFDFYKKYDVDKDGIKELVIVIRSKEIVNWGDDDYYAYKICVLKRKNNHLTFIDSTMPYNGNGTDTYIAGDSLIFTSRFSKGHYQLTYKPDNRTKHFRLTAITYTYGAEPYPRNYFYVDVKQVYNVKTNKLYYHTALYKVNKKTNKDSFVKAKNKVISIKPVNKVGTLLREMKDPQLNYDDLFITSGPIDDEMMDY